MAKRVERQSLRLKVTPWWWVPVATATTVLIDMLLNVRLVSPPLMWVGGIFAGCTIWMHWSWLDYRAYTKRMLPIVNGCPDHPSYQGRGNVKGYICPTCAAIRYARLSLFPEERKS